MSVVPQQMFPIPSTFLQQPSARFRQRISSLSPQTLSLIRLRNAKEGNGMDLREVRPTSPQKNKTLTHWTKQLVNHKDIYPSAAYTVAKFNRVYDQTTNVIPSMLLEVP